MPPGPACARAGRARSCARPAARSRAAPEAPAQLGEARGARVDASRPGPPVCSRRTPAPPERHRRELHRRRLVGLGLVGLGLRAHGAFVYLNIHESRNEGHGGRGGRAARKPCARAGAIRARTAGSSGRFPVAVYRPPPIDRLDSGPWAPLLLTPATPPVRTRSPPSCRPRQARRARSRWRRCSASICPRCARGSAIAATGSSPARRRLGLVQSVCRKVIEHIDRFEHRSEAGFKQWLYRTAERKIIDRYRYYTADKREAAREAARRRRRNEDGNRPSPRCARLVGRRRARRRSRARSWPPRRGPSAGCPAVTAR